MEKNRTTLQSEGREIQMSELKVDYASNMWPDMKVYFAEDVDSYIAEIKADNKKLKRALA